MHPLPLDASFLAALPLPSRISVAQIAEIHLEGDGLDESALGIVEWFHAARGARAQAGAKAANYHYCDTDGDGLSRRR